MDKDQAIKLMKQIQSFVRATPQEHEVISNAIAFLETLEQPQKAQ